MSERWRLVLPEDRTLDRLARRGHLDWLLELAAAADARWSLAVPASVDWARTGETGVLSASLAHGERRFPVTFFDLARFAVAVGWDDLDDLVHRCTEPRAVEFHEKNVVRNARRPRARGRSRPEPDG